MKKLRVLGVALILALGPPSWAQEVSPALLQAAQAAYQQQQQEEPQLLPPVEVDPKLVGKKVEVHYRDGRTLKGKLVELGPDFLQLEKRGQIVRIPLTEVVTVQQSRRNWKPALLIIGIAVATWVIAGIAVSKKEG